MIEKHTGRLPKGCELCFQGKKSVLFITGLCPRNCLYCPLSEEKKNHDIININELKTSNPEEILKEIELSGSEGIGITGGDPLSVLNRTVGIIKDCKKRFGKNFHIHLYTSLNLISEKVLSELKKAGLDEIRVHPDLNNDANWEKIKLLKGRFSEFGIEIPAFPGEEKKIIKLINFSKDFVDFYNLNQLEYATLYEDFYKKKKWKVEEDYSVKGSEKTALKIIKQFPSLRIHYCSSQFKDKIQFTNRIRLRAKNTAEEFDKITEDGTLLRGVISCTEDIEGLAKKIKKKYKIALKIEKNKNRILFNPDLAHRLSEDFPGVAIVEEYPTVDALEVEKEILS